jgi:hypothetical protein
LWTCTCGAIGSSATLPFRVAFAPARQQIALGGPASLHASDTSSQGRHIAVQ